MKNWLRSLLLMALFYKKNMETTILYTSENNAVIYIKLSIKNLVVLQILASVQ